MTTKYLNNYGGAASMTINGTSHVAPNNVVRGNTLLTDQIEPGTLDAYVDAVAETSTMTLALRWQVSDDGTTWKDVMPLGDTSATDPVITTGTGSAVEAKKLFSAPPAVFAHRYAAIALVVGVADSGNAADAWAYSYNYQKRAFF